MTVLLAASAVLALRPAAAQQREHAPFKRITLSSLTAQGFEVKAFAEGGAVIVQKGQDVYRCNLRVADTSPLSYQSDCYSIH